MRIKIESRIQILMKVKKGIRIRNTCLWQCKQLPSRSGEKEICAIWKTKEN
jgi:hypothetical protein